MSGSNGSEVRAYTFDWRAGEHARVTSLLVREQFGTGIRRAMKWGVVIILVLGAVVAVATAIAGSLAEAMPLGALVMAGRLDSSLAAEAHRSQRRSPDHSFAG
jgi:hypothetical protein